MRPTERRIRRAALAALLLWSAPLRAQPPVQLDIDECVAAPRAELERLCALELGAVPLPPAGAEPPGDATRLSLRCRAGLIELSVLDPVTGKSAARLIDPGDLPPESRARLLALALAELAAASWAELTLPQRVPVLGVTAAEPVRRAAAAAVLRRFPGGSSGARPERGRVRLGLSVSGGIQAPLRADRAVLLGGGVRLSAAHRPGLLWALELLYFDGRDGTSLGQVTTDMLSVGAALLWERRGGRFAGHLGGGVRGGAVRVAGEPASGSGAIGDSLWGPTVGLYAAAGGEVAAGPLVIGLLGDGGYVLVPVTGRVAGNDAAGVAGGWLGLRLSIGVKR